MPKQPLSLESITSSVKILMSEIDKLNTEQLAVFTYGIFISQKENPDFTLEESIDYSKKKWLDLI